MGSVEPPSGWTWEQKRSFWDEKLRDDKTLSHEERAKILLLIADSYLDERNQEAMQGAVLRAIEEIRGCEGEIADAIRDQTKYYLKGGADPLADPKWWHAIAPMLGITAGAYWHYRPSTPLVLLLVLMPIPVCWFLAAAGNPYRGPVTMRLTCGLWLAFLLLFGLILILLRIHD